MSGSILERRTSYGAPRHVSELSTTTTMMEVRIVQARSLDGGHIAGAVVGSFVGALLILLCAFPFIRRRWRQRRRVSHGDDYPPEMDTSGPYTGDAERRIPQTPSFTQQNEFQTSLPESKPTSTASHSPENGQPNGLANHPLYAQNPVAGPNHHNGSLSTPSAFPSNGNAVANAEPGQSEADVPSLATSTPSKVYPEPIPWSELRRTPIEQRRSTFGAHGTSTCEQSPRSATHHITRPAPGGSFGASFRKFSSKATLAWRNSRDSSLSSARGLSTRAGTWEIDRLPAGSMPVQLVDYRPPEGGLAASYYLDTFDTSVAEDAAQLDALQGNGDLARIIYDEPLGLEGTAEASDAPAELGSPFRPDVAVLASSASPVIKTEYLSDEDHQFSSPETKKSDTVTPETYNGMARMKVGSEERRLVASPSPSMPGPGTVNPMDIMAPSNSNEQHLWVNDQLWKLENSPTPPRNLESPPGSAVPPPLSTPPLPSPPIFAIRHPTQDNYQTITNGNGHSNGHVDQQEHIAYFSASDMSTPPADYLTPGQSNEDTPDTRQTYSLSPQITGNSAHSGNSRFSIHSGNSAYSGNSDNSAFSNFSTYSGSHNYVAAGQVMQVSEGTTTDQANPSISHPDTLSPEAPKTYQCDECSVHFDQLHKLNHHRRYHTKPHPCPSCSRRFGTKTHLVRHINDKHDKSRKYYCTFDGCAYAKMGGRRSFPRKDNCVRHMQNKHRQVAPEPLEELVVGHDDSVMDEA